MSKMSHINVMEKYEEHRESIHHLLGSILSCFANEKMFEQSQKELSALFTSLNDYYPFVSILYLLDENGRQICHNIANTHFKHTQAIGEGIDRSQRPYFLSAIKSDLPAITEPYLSTVGRELCLSASTKIYDEKGTLKGYIILDIDLNEMLIFFTGESKRVYFEPFFKAMYSLIVFGLFLVSLFLIYSSAVECYRIFYSLIRDRLSIEIPFGMVIYLTLALAIFDLGKTILEEEVLLYKDISRHSSTRRTITRFIAAIIIAISIEALLMVFKSALHGKEEHIIGAVWIILAAGVLLLSLGVYIYLSSKSEALLIDYRNKHKNRQQK